MAGDLKGISQSAVDLNDDLFVFNKEKIDLLKEKSKLENMNRNATITEILETTIEADIPLLLWSAPGAGKTGIIDTMAKERGWFSKTIIASVYQPQDFLGYPMLDDGELTFAPPAWAVKIKENLDKGVRCLLFIDELNTAPRAVQAALLRVVNERRSGDVDLSGCRIICAANDRDHSDGYKLSNAMLNRFCHVDFDVSISEWVDWIQGIGQDKNVSKEFNDIDLEKYKKYLLVTAELIAQDSSIDTGVRGLKHNQKAWVSKRTVDMMCKYLAFLTANGKDWEAYMSPIKGIVGDKSLAIMENIRSKLIPSLDDMFKGINNKFKYFEPEDVTAFISTMASSLRDESLFDGGAFNGADLSQAEIGLWNKFVAVISILSTTKYKDQLASLAKPAIDVSLRHSELQVPDCLYEISGIDPFVKVTNKGPQYQSKSYNSQAEWAKL